MVPSSSTNLEYVSTNEVTIERLYCRRMNSSKDGVILVTCTTNSDEYIGSIHLTHCEVCCSYRSRFGRLGHQGDLGPPSFNYPNYVAFEFVSTIYPTYCSHNHRSFTLPMGHNSCPQKAARHFESVNQLLIHR